MKNTDLAIALFEAIAKGDAEGIRSCCTADFEGRQNGGVAMNISQLSDFALAVHQIVDGLRYEDIVRSETSTGFVEEHSVRGTLPDGSSMELTVCVVAEVLDFKVRAIREYYDVSPAAGLVNALS
ncbi:MAG: ketosteroid isomerase-like protein [Halioglobus sp.]